MGHPKGFQKLWSVGKKSDPLFGGKLEGMCLKQIGGW